MSDTDRRVHPLAAVLAAAADGRFPPADGAVEVLPPDGPVVAVVALTGRAYVCADVEPAEVIARGGDGYGGVYLPPVVSWLAGADGQVGCIDVVLARRGTGGGPPPARHDLDDHPRVVRARHHRRHVEVFADDAGLVLVGDGLVGRRELAVELFDPSATGGAGRGRRLIELGLAAVPATTWCWAQVSPGNAASLRAFLAAGFVPIGSELLIDRPVR